MKSLPSVPQFPFEKSLCGRHCSSKPLPSFPYTPTLWQVKSLTQGQLLPTSSPVSRCCQDPPTVLADDCHPTLSVLPAVCMCAVFPWGLYTFKSLLVQFCDSPAVGGEGASRLLLLSWLSSHVVTTARFWCHAQGLSPYAYKTTLPPLLKHPLHNLASKLQTS